MLAFLIPYITEPIIDSILLILGYYGVYGLLSYILTTTTSRSTPYKTSSHFNFIIRLELYKKVTYHINKKMGNIMTDQKKSKYLIKTLFVLLLFLLPQSSSTQEKIHFDVEKFQLPNGLTVLLHEDHSIPLISYHTWFKVGSKDEEPGLTGIAHLFEHIMFKGAKRYGNKEFDQILRSQGAINNAFTGKDYTGYYINLPSSGLEIVMDLESDRMQSIQITEANLKSEKEVTKEERRFRVENSVPGTISENLFLTVFQRHPYRFPVVGLMNDLNNVTVEKCKEFFKQYYAPNNAVIVIVGDFDKKKAKKLLHKYYGSIPKQSIHRRSYLQEAAQKKRRSKVIFKDVQNESLAIGFRISKAGDLDSYALDLLADILAGKKSSRLYKRLVYQSQLASSVSAYAYTPKDPGLLQISVSLKPQSNSKAVLKIISEELQKMQKKPFTEDELQQAKTSVLLSHINSMKSFHGKAQSLALNEVVMGDYQFFFKDIERYSKIETQQIQDVAKKYLNPWQETRIYIKPKKHLAFKTSKKSGKSQ